MVRELAVASGAWVRTNGDGEDCPAALARLRVFVDRAKEGRPEGDLVMPVLVLVLVRLTEGEARLASDAVVLDLGKAVRGV